MSVFAYLFEAHSIQRYILDSGRLAEMVGASELVESLTATGGTALDGTTAIGLLDRVLEKLDLSQPPEISRRAGGAITAFFGNRGDALRFRDLWSLLIEQYAPGLAYSHVVAVGENAASAAEAGKEAKNVVVE